jgi:hypothetical protein
VWTVLVKSWTIEEVAVEFADGVNGENRARLGKICDYYKFGFDCFEDGSSNTLQNIITYQSNQDANQPDLAFNSGILFAYNNGAKAAFTLGGQTVLGPYKGGSSGRTERVMHNLTGRAQLFQSVVTA